MKTCRKCSVSKDPSDFYKAAVNSDGRANICKICKDASTISWREKNKDAWNAYMRNHRKEHPSSLKDKERNAARARKSRYGLSQEQYEAMLETQNHACAICFKHKDGFVKRLSVDHCHTSGKVRGLLCDRCNYYLGYIAEDEKVVAALIRYIRAR